MTRICDHKVYIEEDSIELEPEEVAEVLSGLGLLAPWKLHSHLHISYMAMSNPHQSEKNSWEICCSLSQHQNYIKISSAGYFCCLTCDNDL